MPKYFVCLDTCVLVRLYLRLRSGGELKGFDDLKALVEANEVTLLVPQVTQLELQKFVDKAERDLLLTTTRIENAVKSEGKHVKDDLAQALAGPLDTWRNKKASDMRAVAKGIFDWLATGEPIKFTQEIAHETRCRIIAGKFPDPRFKQKRDSEDSEDKKDKEGKPEDKRDQDCFIIDSLVARFNGDITDKSLLFATTDNGFGAFKDDGTGPLDPTFQDGLPPTLIFNDLSKLVQFVKDKKTITLPTKAEVEAEQKLEIEQELKFKQEATAEVVPGGRVLEIVVADTVGAQDQMTVRRQRLVPGMKLGGVFLGQHWVEDPSGDQPFFDMSYVPEPPKMPVEGFTNFDASNLGDESQKSPEAKDDPEPEEPKTP
jgi:hypothetical protein